MSSSDAATAKAALRKQLRQQRASHKAGHAEIANLCSNLIEAVGDARVIAAYLPIADEPDIRAFINHLLADGRRVLLPRVVGDDLQWVDFDGSTSEGELGFAEANGPAADLSDASFIIAPALAVDKTGMRIGKGRGYYDRALASVTAVVVAVVFDDEFIDEIKHEPHDRHVAGVITPSRIIWF